MQKHKTIKVKHAVLDSLKCDRCKKELIDDEMALQEVHTISFQGGYGSPFGDGNRIDCDLCQECLYELIGDFCEYNLGIKE